MWNLCHINVDSMRRGQKMNQKVWRDLGGLLSCKQYIERLDPEIPGLVNCDTIQWRQNTSDVSLGTQVCSWEKEPMSTTWVILYNRVDSDVTGSISCLVQRLVHIFLLLPHVSELATRIAPHQQKGEYNSFSCQDYMSIQIFQWPFVSQKVFYYPCMYLELFHILKCGWNCSLRIGLTSENLQGMEQAKILLKSQTKNDKETPAFYQNWTRNHTTNTYKCT